MFEIEMAINQWVGQSSRRMAYRMPNEHDLGVVDSALDLEHPALQSSALPSLRSITQPPLPTQREKFCQRYCKKSPCEGPCSRAYSKGLG